MRKKSTVSRTPLTSLALIGLMAIAFGCATTPTQQKQVDAAVVLTKAVADSGLVDANAAKQIDTAVSTYKAVEEVKTLVQSNVIVIVKPKDTLWGIAATYYAGNDRIPHGKGGFLWPAICEANNLKNCNLITVAQVLKVPSPDTVNAMPTSQITEYLKTAYEAK